MTKSKAAFLLTVRSLFKHPNGCRRRVYMWTFTFRTVQDDKICFKCWKHLNTLLSREFGKGGCDGVRVVEVHPGGHGLHFHALIAARLPVKVVRRLAIRAGFGRIHVQKAGIHSAEYLAKYLSKEDDGLTRGTRRWGNLAGFKGTRVRDIVVESTLAENCRRVRDVLKVWGPELFVMVNQLTCRYGHVLDWPVFPELQDIPRYEHSDNDLPEQIRHEWPYVFEENGVFYGFAPGGMVEEKPKPVFEKLRIHDSDLGEYVTCIIPSTVQQPF